MKALTIDQPYASLIMAGVKQWETRPFPPTIETHSGVWSEGDTTALIGSSGRVVTTANGIVFPLIVSLRSDTILWAFPCHRCHDQPCDDRQTDDRLCELCETTLRNRTYTAMAVALAALCVLMIYLNGAT